MLRLRTIGLLGFATLLRASGPQFEPNSGQAEARYLYLARVAASRVYLEDRSVTFRAPSGNDVRLSWIHASPDSSAPQWTAAEPTGDVSHYCNQPDRDLCRQAIPSYRRLLRQNLYPNIDWSVYGRDGRFEYDLIVHPGGDLDAARLSVDGAAARLHAGELHAGAIVHWRPEAYQWVEGVRVSVPVSLRQTGDGSFGFAASDYRRDLDLIVDPVIQPIGVAAGSGDDSIVGTATGSSCSFRYGITNSADWSGLPGPGHSVFAQITQTGRGSETVFWGGTGDSQVGGADQDPVNCRLYVVGWTSAQDAPTLDSPYDHLFSRPYAGGSTDGFFLEVGYNGLQFASYLGGPGADRIYDVRRTTASGSLGPFAIAGQTDNSSWPLSTAQQIGPGGQADAFVGLLNGTQVNLMVLGGSGNDRAMRLRGIDANYWAVGGETDSADFPSMSGTQSASGKDLWIGRIARDLSAIPVLRLFGGSGDEQFGGLASITTRGLYLAGTTNSPDLPSATNSFQGGVSDGFVVALDPLTAIPVAASYIGGSGRDEIASLDTDGSSLLLGGDTDSTDLVLPGLAAGQNVLGGLDALFVLAEPDGTLARGIRFGGSADDRVLGLEPMVFGQVNLAGASQSQDWLQALDPYATGLGAQDGFAVSLSFANLQFAPQFGNTPGSGNVPIPPNADLYLGKDLQVTVQLGVTSEVGMDGILTVTTSDPSRLLVSANSSLPGTGVVLLTSVDSPSYGANSFTLQALADTGEVDVVVQGRSTASPNGIYPRRVLRVQLTPAALFVSSAKDVTVAVGNSTTVSFSSAPLLPDGAAGPVEYPRVGTSITPALTTSDPSGLSVPANSVSAYYSNQFNGVAQAVSPGTYSLSVSSPQVSSAPGQVVTVHVVNKIAPSVFSGKNYYLQKGMVAFFQLSGAAGDRLVFTSDDPSRLLIGSDASASAATATLSFSNSYSTLWLAGVAGDGTVTLHVSGAYGGQPVSESAQVRLVPYKVTFAVSLTTIGVGSVITPSITLTPQIAPDLATWVYLQGTPRFVSFANLQLQSSNPAALQPQPVSNLLYFPFLAAAPGTATLSFAPSAPAEFAGLSATVLVVPPAISFGVSTFRIPVGTQAAFSPVYQYPASPTNTVKAVRLRLNTGAPLTIRTDCGSGADVTCDYSNGIGFYLVPQNAQAGQQATLFISSPAVAEFSMPVHIVAPVFVPDEQEVRLAVGGPQYLNSVSFHLAGDDAGQIFGIGNAFFVQKVALSPVVNPSGICTVPASVDASLSVSVTLNCTAPGVVMLTLQPAAGLSSLQSQYSLKVIAQPAPPAPLAISGRVLTGNGLQSELSMYSYVNYTTLGPFTGAITSCDPSRVLLSLDKNAPGTASVTVPSDGSVRSVFVQGYASDGVVPLAIQSTDGRSGQMTVYLFPATMAVRPWTQNYVDSSPALSTTQPLSSPDSIMDVRPYLVDSGTSKLLWSPSLSIRGGSDPVFVRAQTSDNTIIQTVPPDALMSEGDTASTLKFHAIATGDVALSASQPSGFIAVPDSALQVHVFEQGLGFSPSPLLSADLQTPVSIVGTSGGSVTNVTATSLDPQKLLLATTSNAPGQASVTVPPYGGLYLQTLSGVQPGDKTTVQLDGPGFLSSQVVVPFTAAVLQTQNSAALSLQPLTNGFLSLVYGPVDSQGRPLNFNGTIRPGVNTLLQVSSTDTSIVTVGQSSVPLNTFVSIPLRPLAPGHAQILVQAPPQINNQAATVDVVVGPYQFSPPIIDYPSRYLISKFTVTNPRAQQTPLTITSTGIAQVRLGTAAGGAGLPSVLPLAVTLDANETRTLYLEPAAAGNSMSIQLAAAGFANGSGFQTVSDPVVNFLSNGPLNLGLNGGAVPVTVVLNGSSPTRELPLGTAFGPLNIQLQTSKAGVVTVPSAPLSFAPGDSRKTFLLQPVGAGDAVVSLIIPGAFAGSAPTRQDIVVSVR